MILTCHSFRCKPSNDSLRRAFLSRHPLVFRRHVKKKQMFLALLSHIFVTIAFQDSHNSHQNLWAKYFIFYHCLILGNTAIFPLLLISFSTVSPLLGSFSFLQEHFYICSFLHLLFIKLNLSFFFLLYEKVCINYFLFLFLSSFSNSKSSPFSILSRSPSISFSLSFFLYVFFPFYNSLLVAFFFWLLSLSLFLSFPIHLLTRHSKPFLPFLLPYRLTRVSFPPTAIRFCLSHTIFPPFPITLSTLFTNL